MKVKLLSMTPNMKKVLYTAIRTCKSINSPEEIFYNWSYNTDQEDLIIKCFNAGHLSIFEHVLMSFSVEGVSRALLSQYSRHRIGISLSVQSQRSVVLDLLNSDYENKLFNFESLNNFVLPESLKNNEIKNKKVLMIDESLDKVFNKDFLDSLDIEKLAVLSVYLDQVLYYNLMCNKIEKGDARYFMPLGSTCNFVTSLNLRSLIDIFYKRNIKQAQDEIRYLVCNFARIMIDKEPWLKNIFKFEI